MKKLLLYLCLLLPFGSAFATNKTIEVKTAGSLLSLISEELRSLTDLTITGELNSKDFVVLKKMGTSEVLEHLDLSDVTIKDDKGNVTNSIIKNAFWEASKLKSIILPKSAISIEGYFAGGNTALESIVLPENLTYIAEESFWGCNDIESITISDKNQHFKTTENILFTKDGTKLILYPSTKKNEEYTIPEGVKIIKTGSFESCDYIKVLNFPSTLEIVEGWTCRYLPNLKKLELPKSLKKIGSYAFSKNGVTEIYLKSNTPPSLDRDAFWLNKEDCRVFVPKGSYYNYWLDDSWSDFKGIEEYDYIDDEEEEEEEEGEEVFGENYNISVKHTDGNIYYLKYLSIIENKDIYEVSITTKDEYTQSYSGKIVIPEFVKFKGINWKIVDISTSAFTNCKNIESITINKNIKNLSPNSFYGCDKLASINVDPLNSKYHSIDGILYNHESQSVIRCPGGKKGTTTIPNGILKIEKSAFSLCSIENVLLPNTIEIIGDYAFANCNNIKEITLPESIIGIGSGAFECPNLRTVYSMAINPPSVPHDAFHFSKDTLFVPKEALDNYLNNKDWNKDEELKKFAKIAAIGGEVVANEKINTQKANIQIRSTTNGILLNSKENKMIMIFTIEGRLVKQVKPSQEQFVSLPSGSYIITNGTETQKIIVYM